MFTAHRQQGQCDKSGGDRRRPKMLGWGCAEQTVGGGEDSFRGWMAAASEVPSGGAWWGDAAGTADLRVCIGESTRWP